nr:RNA-binding domain-containing protein [Candidatus Freyrarchaeum guaymaensis]
MRIRVETPLNPTEDLSKVIKALKTVLETEYSVQEEEDTRKVVGEAEGIDRLQQFYNRLREQYIVEAARELLKKRAREREVIFFLNKQAAYVGKISFCAPEKESPMGAIKVTITSDKIEEVIDWLCPKTVKGKPQEVEPPIDA